MMRSQSLSNQQGIILFFALMVLLMMTLIGVALAMNSTQAMRMASAGTERTAVFASVKGAQAKVLVDKQGADLANLIVAEQVNDTDLDVLNTLTPSALGDVNCQRSALASSANLINCRRLEISSEASFGRRQLGQLSIVSGIEQEVLTGS